MRRKQEAGRRAIHGRLVPPELAEHRAKINRLFARHPASRELYAHVRDYLLSLGSVAIIPRETQVGFAHRRLFAWIWLPQLWIQKAPTDGLALTFSLAHRVTDRRIKECVEPYPGRFTHHVVMRRSRELDVKMRGWLLEAYELAGRPRSGHTRAVAARKSAAAH